MTSRLEAANHLAIIAHRGGLGHGPENALSTIEQSLAQNVEAIEIDIYAVDGELLITHDRLLGKSLSGSGRLQDLSKDEAKKLSLPNGEPVPTLTDVLQLVGKQCDINLEIKGCDNIVELLIETVMEFVNKDHCELDQFIISSFDHRHLEKALAIQPDIKRGVLIDGVLTDYCASFEHLKGWSLHPRITFTPRELIDDAHDRGYKVYVYTVNNEKDIQDMIDWGVDGIFTDFPEQAKKIRDTY
ncbi:MAG: glycerophosphodiester phosphodiesterase [Cellvibrionaceae bacterium]